MSEDNTLNDIRSSLIRKKERLNDINNAFKSLAVKERDPFKRLVSNILR
ncbi:MAG TPA: hypothetical protein VFY64_01280 [Nitrososphaeraceae archaeon]|nr:hypothetical protein [Nitrososphaeraceae archaeon]